MVVRLVEMEGVPVSVLVETTQPTLIPRSRPTALVAALREVELKRTSDLIRFRTCCADPRASK